MQFIVYSLYLNKAILKIILITGERRCCYHRKGLFPLQLPGPLREGFLSLRTAGNPLSWGAVLCVAGCLAASLTYTRNVPAAPPTLLQRLRHFRMSPGGQNRPWLGTTTPDHGSFTHRLTKTLKREPADRQTLGQIRAGEWKLSFKASRPHSAPVGLAGSGPHPGSTI